jgi:hypothetical protein
VDQLKDLSRDQLEELLQDFAKRWLAHDGLWFQAVEQGRDMDEAIKYDIAAWEKFTVIEAKRIMGFLGLKPGGGLQALEQALKFRLYAFINVQSTEWVNETTLVFKMNDGFSPRAIAKEWLISPASLLGFRNTAYLPRP